MEGQERKNLRDGEMKNSDDFLWRNDTATANRARIWVKLKFLVSLPTQLDYNDVLL